MPASQVGCDSLLGRVQREFSRRATVSKVRSRSQNAVSVMQAEDLGVCNGDVQRGGGHFRNRLWQLTQSSETKAPEFGDCLHRINYKRTRIGPGRKQVCLQVLAGTGRWPRLVVSVELTTEAQLAALVEWVGLTEASALAIRTERFARFGASASGATRVSARSAPKHESRSAGTIQCVLTRRNSRKCASSWPS